jgi:hypothetical protein
MIIAALPGAEANSFRDLAEGSVEIMLFVDITIIICLFQQVQQVE